jgi:hypothetical protein
VNGLLEVILWLAFLVGAGVVVAFLFSHHG